MGAFRIPERQLQKLLFGIRGSLGPAEWRTRFGESEPLAGAVASLVVDD